MKHMLEQNTASSILQIQGDGCGSLDKVPPL